MRTYRVPVHIVYEGEDAMRYPKYFHDSGIDYSCYEDGESFVVTADTTDEQHEWLLSLGAEIG